VLHEEGKRNLLGCNEISFICQKKTKKKNDSNLKIQYSRILEDGTMGSSLASDGEEANAKGQLITYSCYLITAFICGRNNSQ
jgi:hypothetical protein